MNEVNGNIWGFRIKSRTFYNYDDNYIFNITHTHTFILQLGIVN